MSPTPPCMPAAARFWPAWAWARADDLSCKPGATIPQEPVTSRAAVTSSSNHDEFGTGKSDPEARAGKLKTRPWSGPRECPASAAPSWTGPHVEELRMDEAMHSLTLIATGLRGQALPNQNGAPPRLVVPWKYGSKGIKAVARISLPKEKPKTTWNLLASSEHGF